MRSESTRGSRHAPPPHHAHTETVAWIRSTAASSPVAPSSCHPRQLSSLNTVKVRGQLDVVFKGGPLGGEWIVFCDRVPLVWVGEEKNAPRFAPPWTPRSLGVANPQDALSVRTTLV